MMQWSDALGKLHGRYPGLPRIVSLVPSLTELLIALGLAEQLVGRTGFCIHPRATVRRIAKLGGTKGFDRERLRALQPTHVLVNIDENRRDEVAALADFVPHLIVTHPLAARDNLDLYRLLGGIFNREDEAAALSVAFEREWAALSEVVAMLPRQQVLYLVWRDPWFSVARDTYISRMLAAAGWDTLPSASAQRYPQVELADAVRDAEIVFLASEPYPFRERDRRQLQGEMPARCWQLIDGEMVSWYGSRAVTGLAYLRQLRLRLRQSAGT
ncbi:helical backbone metal receptor [Accumulibacter sp.]|uniref:helical backbone metal receptor n=1 Tax=Accumulibacter sp. TaxID=2053492 RepID=UPI002D1FA9E5|nr:helical backbone metal receptor [Accumulibacter sp.]